MRTVYGIQFQVHPNDGQLATDCVADLRDLGAEWMTRKYQRAWGTDIEVKFDGSLLEPLDGHWIRANHQAHDIYELVTVEWGHPNDRDDSVVWVTSCTYARNGEAVHASISIRISSVRFVVRPTKFDLGRPKLVWDILRRYQCTINGQPIPLGHKTVRAVDVPAFVEKELLRKERVLPIVVVTPGSWTENPVVASGVLHNKVAGFAQVVQMDDKWAAFKLTDEVGRDLSCFNGAVRVYWPGFKLDDPSFRHPLFLAASIRHHKQHDRNLEDHLFRMFASMSAFRVGELGPVRDVRRKIDSQRSIQMNRLREQVKAGNAENSELLDELERTWEVGKRLTDERDELAEKVVELSSQLKAAQENIVVMSHHIGEASVEEDDFKPDNAEEQPVKFANVMDAYQKAKADFTGPIVFLDSAEVSVKDSPYQNPDLAYELFTALHLVTSEWKQKNGVLGRSFKDAMKDLGFDVHGVSGTSKGKWREQYTFDYKGDRLLFEDHVTLGAKQANKCLSIHWYRDEEDLVVAIGHCGIHLKNTSK
jgi:hypothetical protein